MNPNTIGSEGSNKEYLVTSERLDDESEGDKGARVSINTPPQYKTFSELYPLYGDKYEIIKKLEFYSIVGSLLIDCPIVIGDVYLDTRIHHAIALESGSGKFDLRTVREEILKKLKVDYAKPTSFHPEQFVGRTLFRNDQPIQNYGYLAKKHVIIEEGRDLMTEHEHETTRKYIQEATDPYPKNEIKKQNLDTLEHEAIKYPSPSTIMVIFQPVILDGSLITVGFLRRFFISYIEVEIDEKLDAGRQRLTNNSPNKREANLELFVKSIRGIIDITKSAERWTFSKESIDKIIDCYEKLVWLGYAQGKVALEYTKTMHFELQNRLIKMSVIQVVCHGRTIVNEEDVERAFADLLEFWKMQLDFVTKYVTMPTFKGGLTHQLITCIKILDERRCYDKDSGIPIGEFDKLIAKELRLSSSSARNTYRRKLKRMDLVDSVQIGQKSTSIWLTAKGREILHDPSYHPDTLGTIPEDPVKLQIKGSGGNATTYHSLKSETKSDSTTRHLNTTGDYCVTKLLGEQLQGEDRSKPEKEGAI